MAKLGISAALFAALIAMAAAAATTTYTTMVIATTLVEEENPHRQSCQREIQQMPPMKSCMQWMQSMMGGGPYVSNPRYILDEDHLHECCNEMWGVSTPCRCEAMKQVMRQMMQQQQHGTEEVMQQQHGTEEVMQQMMKQKMQSLPQMCGMKSTTQCSFQTIFV
ncbi:hypothetical protein ABFS82_13G168300 [Erythranthe guttata]|uniref:Bifunctional inhibitor/plant lipid transfer protein/seed storage helical domain-containing protein n=1 Tax=Erythranthe guttata TaxID=4155 RepID=A0A022QLI2_ERYGU|nr:PREDICTED: 2S seed storage protein 1-like [Erythranthe guttata]EYU27340.1 hypothetical protein MIMGU_mgv1a015254mg [Erythranthe guttata]|eukprot:XP_012849100.1 PREDICTED: 2S seed storage protein 1-like [Erythranthe guttata]